MIHAPIIARLNSLSRLAKTGTVIGGYVAAFALALIAVTVHVILTSGPDRDASSGMHAFGDALLFIFAFGVIATAPTALALYFLRTNRAFWSLISIAALAVSVTGLASAASIATSQANTSISSEHQYKHLAHPGSATNIDCTFASRTFYTVQSLRTGSS